jgi:hypothetical protein
MAKLWVSDRALKFEPKFLSSFRRTIRGVTVKVKDLIKIHMIFKTTSTEPGTNVLYPKKNAEIDAEVTIVETADRDKEIAVISI